MTDETTLTDRQAEALQSARAVVSTVPGAKVMLPEDLDRIRAEAQLAGWTARGEADAEIARGGGAGEVDEGWDGYNDASFDIERAIRAVPAPSVAQPAAGVSSIVSQELLTRYAALERAVGDDRK